MRTPEGKIKDEIRAWLRQQGAYVFSPVQMGYGTQTLDLLVCWQGVFWAIEVKAPGKKMTARQQKISEEIMDAGGYFVCVDSLGKAVIALNLMRPLHGTAVPR